MLVVTCCLGTTLHASTYQHTTMVHMQVKMISSRSAAMQSAPAIDMYFAPVAFRQARFNKESQGDMVFFENCTQAYGHAATYQRSGAQEGVNMVSV